MVIITKLQVAPVELVVSSESSCAVRLARHSQNAARHVERVESCRVESRRAKWNLGFTSALVTCKAFHSMAYVVLFWSYNRIVFNAIFCWISKIADRKWWWHSNCYEKLRCSKSKRSLYAKAYTHYFNRQRALWKNPKYQNFAIGANNHVVPRGKYGYKASAYSDLKLQWATSSLAEYDDGEQYPEVVIT